MKKLLVSTIRGLHFGRHLDRSFDLFSSQFVVVYGKNETGKSTLAEFLTWSIGGPWRTKADNSLAYVIPTGNVVYAHVTTVFDEKPLDLDAKFRIKERGSPEDLRNAAFNGREVNAQVLRELWGDLDPKDYELMYRLYGPTLGKLGSSESFSSLFSTFAIGSATSSTNPRDVLNDLSTRQRGMTNLQRDLKTTMKDVQRQIKDALRAPEELDKIRDDITQFQVRIDSLRSEAEALTSEKELIKRLIDGEEHLLGQRGAQERLAKLPAVSKEMTRVVEQLPKIEETVGNKSTAEIDAREAKQRADAAIKRSGLNPGLITGEVLSPSERVSITNAARGVIDARSQLTESRKAAEEVETAIRLKQSNVEQLCRQSGLTEAHLDALDRLPTDFRGLAERAGRWVEEVNKLIAAEGRLSGHQKTSSLSGSQTRVDSRLPWAAFAAGTVVVALVGMWQPIAGLVVAAVLAATTVFLGRRARSSSNFTIDSSATDTYAANLMRDVETYRKESASHRELLLNGMGSLAELIDTPDTARARIENLEVIAKERVALSQLQESLGDAHLKISAAEARVLETQSAAERALAERSIPLSLIDNLFESWLADFEAALVANAAYLRAREQLDQIDSDLRGMLTPISADASGLDLQTILERLREAAEILRLRKEAEQDLHNAQVSLSAANLDSSKAKSLREQYEDVSEMIARRTTLETTLAELVTSRDEALQKSTLLQRDLEERDGREVLPDLNLRKSTIEDSLQEVGDQIKAVDLARRILTETLDRYERENQEPAVETASALIADVVPDWGTVVFSRDEREAPVLERASGLGRLHEDLLSDGARALLYLGIRLAFVQKNAERTGVALPIICDDPLLHFDDERSAAALRLLAKFSEDHQVILFTYDNQTRDLASTLGATVIQL